MRWLMLLLVAGCQAIPDNPEIHDATVVMSSMGPGGYSRLIVSCPAGQLPLVTTTKPAARR